MATNDHESGRRIPEPTSRTPSFRIPSGARSQLAPLPIPRYSPLRKRSVGRIVFSVSPIRQSDRTSPSQLSSAIVSTQLERIRRRNGRSRRVQRVWSIDALDFRSERTREYAFAAAGGEGG